MPFSLGHFFGRYAGLYFTVFYEFRKVELVDVVTVTF